MSEQIYTKLPLTEIAKLLGEANVLVIGNLGYLYLNYREPRQAKNPLTKEPLQIPGKLSVTFDTNGFTEDNQILASKVFGDKKLHASELEYITIVENIDAGNEAFELKDPEGNLIGQLSKKLIGAGLQRKPEKNTAQYYYKFISSPELVEATTSTAEFGIVWVSKPKEQSANESDQGYELKELRKVKI